ncbi:MAG: leucine-rich repeat domain-containing protein [Paludibacter sp.]
MKKLIILVLTMSVSLLAETQIYKTVNITTAGTLSTILNDYEKATITNLTVTGNIDARDIKCIRDLILLDLNISETNIIAYTGLLGTGTFYSNPTTIISYPANEMPEYSFYNSMKSVRIQTVYLPKSITSIGYKAFNSCGTLTNILIPNSVTNIGAYAFNMCEKLTNISIPNTITNIGDYAFFQCMNLTGDLFIPKSIRIIGSNVFDTCEKLTSVTFENSNPLAYFTSIGNSAFSQCAAMKKLTLSNAVSSIGEFAFNSCWGLTTIYSCNTTPPTLGSSCFNGVSNVTDVFVPTDEAVIAYKAINTTVWTGNKGWILAFPGNIIKKGSISDTPETQNNHVNVYSDQNGIVVEGVLIGEKVKIFSVHGVCLQTLKSKGELLVIPIARKALYIVETSTKTFKVQIQ